jgi:hypothetical protein
MSATWMHLIEALEPDYLKYKNTLEEGSTILTTIEQNGKLWNLNITEKWVGEDPGLLDIFTTITFDKRIEWASVELEKWQHCRRTAWHIWEFKHKRDAEKFITLYNLTWAQYDT